MQEGSKYKEGRGVQPQHDTLTDSLLVSASVRPVGWRHSLQSRFLVYQILVLIFVVGTTVALMLTLERSVLLEQGYRTADQFGRRIVTDLQRHITKTESLTKALANTGETLARKSHLAYDMIPPILNIEGESHFIAGGGIWPEPHAFEKTKERLSYFFGREKDGSLKFYDDYNDPSGPGYHNEEWYVPARFLQSGQAYWSKSYMDPYSYQPMVTCTIPMRIDNAFVGVATVDVKLEGLASFFAAMSKEVGGYIFAVDRNNRLLSFPNESIGKRRQVSVDNKVTETFLMMSDLAGIEPEYHELASTLSDVNLRLEISAQGRNQWYKTTTTQLFQGSYQINEEESSLIAASLSASRPGQPAQIQSEPRQFIKTDPLLNEASMVNAFLVPNTHWKVIVVTPVSKYYTEADRNTKKVMFYVISLEIVALLIMFIVVRRVFLQPIKSMTSQLLHAPADSDKHMVHLRVEGHHELGQLAASFNHRTETLTSVTEELESHLAEQKQTQADLRDSESRLQSILESTTSVVYIKDVDGNYILVNRQYLELLGMTRDQVIGKDDNAIFGPWEARDYIEHDRRVFKANALMEFEETIERRGREYHYIAVKFPLRDSQGNIYALCGVATDITDRLEVQQALTRSEERLRIMLDAMSEAVVATDDQGVITQINPSAEVLLGVERTKAVGHSLLAFGEFKDPESLREMVNPISHVIKTNASYAIAHARFKRTADGMYLDIAGSCSPLSVRKDTHSGCVLVLRDITQAVELETELRQAQKMESVGKLAGGVAHDFNNMLGAIMGTADLLALQTKDKHESLYGSVKLVQEAAARASDLTQQLLAFSRKANIQSRPVDIHHVIEEVINLLSHSVDKRINMRTSLDAKGVVIRGDHSQLQNALLNLGINASDAMPEGGSLVFATSNAELDQAFCDRHREAIEPGRYVEISVADTGSGIPDSFLDKIFEPFFTTKEVGKGTGLGLAAVYGTVREHKGTIEVDSELDRGTVFRIYLPLSSEDANVDARTQEVVRPGSGRVLVVDDEDVMLKTAMSLLENLGYEPIGMNDPEEALNFYREHASNIDLVLLDMVMPKITGGEVFVMLKVINPDVKVVLSSGFTRQEDAASLLQEGAKAFIAKPYARAALSQVLADALTK